MRLTSALFLLPLATAAHTPRRHHARAPNKIREFAGGAYPNTVVQTATASVAASSVAATSAAQVNPVAAGSSSAAGAASSNAGASSAGATSAVTSSAQAQSSAVGSSQSVSTDTGLSDKFPSPTPTTASSTADTATSGDTVATPASSANNLPSTLSIASSTISPAAASATTSLLSSSVTHTTVNLVTTVSKTLSTSASADAASSGSKTTGMNKTTMIIVIVVAVVVGLAILGWCGFRKWKLRPSRKFDEKMKPINFSPYGDMHLEKTHHRSLSNSSAAIQRRDLVDELDKSAYVHGIPEHDFTAGAGVGAGMAGAGAGGYDIYNHDPYAHAEAFEYDPLGDYHQTQPQQHGYQDQDQQFIYDGRYIDVDQPTQDDAEAHGQAQGQGYTDLQRGNSTGSGSGSGHGHGYNGQRYSNGDQMAGQAQQYGQHEYTAAANFPTPDQYIGRPTGGMDGPYAQAAQYRY